MTKVAVIRPPPPPGLGPCFSLIQTSNHSAPSLWMPGPKVLGQAGSNSPNSLQRQRDSWALGSCHVTLLTGLPSECPELHSSVTVEQSHPFCPSRTAIWSARSSPPSCSVIFFSFPFLFSSLSFLLPFFFNNTVRAAPPSKPQRRLEAKMEVRRKGS